MKILGVAISDLHIHDYAKYNEGGRRTEAHLKALAIAVSVARKENVPLLYCGDIFHTEKALSNFLLSEVLVRVKKIVDDVLVFAISGNHDMSKATSKENPSPSYNKMLAGLIKGWHNIDFGEWEIAQGVAVYGIPYLKHNIGFKEAINNIRLQPKCKHILMIHSDLYGAKDTNGREVKTVENIPRKMNRLFDRFDLVLSGHIHQPQQLGHNIYMLGAPLHQRRTDIGSSLGYWLVYEDMTMRFVRLDLPQFKEIEEGKKIPDDFHYYIEIPKEKEIRETTMQFEKEKSKRDIAIEYCKEKEINDRDKIRALKEILTKTEE